MQLPGELIEQVFRHLDVREVAEARGVSRAWRHAADAMPVGPPCRHEPAAAVPAKLPLRDYLMRRLRARAARLDARTQRLSRAAADELRQAMLLPFWGTLLGPAVLACGAASALLGAGLGTFVVLHTPAEAGFHLRKGATALGSLQVEEAGRHTCRAAWLLAECGVLVALCAAHTAAAGASTLLMAPVASLTGGAGGTLAAARSVLIAWSGALAAHRSGLEARELAALMGRRASHEPSVRVPSVG